jgi:hypothetical protein
MLKNPILTIRFNEETWTENCVYRQNNPNIACIYGSKCELNDKYDLKSLFFVIEMNNTLNRIEGIGLIQNKSYIYDRKYSFYTNENYNRYMYKGSFRLDREILLLHNSRLVDVLDSTLFQGRNHFKRGIGFMKLTEKMFLKELYLLFDSDEDLKREIMRIFKIITNN